MDELHRKSPTQPILDRFGAGLTEPDVQAFRAILREDCGLELPLPEAWSRAIELLTLVEMILNQPGERAAGTDSGNGVRVPSLLTESQP